MQRGSNELQTQAGEDEPNIWSSIRLSSAACKRI